MNNKNDVKRGMTRLYESVYGRILTSGGLHFNSVTVDLSSDLAIETLTVTRSSMSFPTFSVLSCCFNIHGTFDAPRIK